MKRKLLMAAVLCIALLATIAMAAAPAVFARAETANVTCIETWAAPPGDPVFYKATGGVAHMEFFNHFLDSAIVPDPALDPLVVGPADTHLFAVARLVDGVPTDAVIRGTFHKVCPAGEWEGTFNGTMSMLTAAWEMTISGRGVSGDVAGMTMLGGSVNATGAFAIVDVRILAPHGF